MKRPLRYVALLPLLALLAAACGGGDQAAQPSGDASEASTAEQAEGEGAASEPVRIGAVLGISGRFAFVGGPQQNALRMAEQEINDAGGIAGRPAEFIIYDDEVDETKSVPLVNRLIGDDEVDAIIGPSITLPALAIAPLVEREQIPNITLTSRAIWEQEDLQYVYQTTPREEVEVLSVLTYIRNELGATKIAVLHDVQPYGTGNLEFIEQFAPQLGMEVVAVEGIGNDEANAVPQIERLSQSDAEVLIIWVGDPAASSAVKAAEQVGWEPEIIGSSAIAGPRFAELAGEAGEDVYSDATLNYVDPPPNQADFLSNYTDQFDEPPTQFAAFAYDAAYALKAAIEHSGGDTSPDAIIQGLNDMPPLEGVTATFDFSESDHNGVGLQPLFYIVQVQNGQFTVVADTSEFEVDVQQ